MEQYKDKIITIIVAVNLIGMVYSVYAVQKLETAMGSVGNALFRSGVVEIAPDGSFEVNRVITTKDVQQ